MIIKLYDNEDYEYPLIQIDKNDLEKFKEILKEYQKKEYYNYDEFIDLLNERGFIFETYNYDIEVFF